MNIIFIKKVLKKASITHISHVDKSKICEFILEETSKLVKIVKRENVLTNVSYSVIEMVCSVIILKLHLMNDIIYSFNIYDTVKKMTGYKDKKRLLSIEFVILHLVEWRLFNLL